MEHAEGKRKRQRDPSKSYAKKTSGRKGKAATLSKKSESHTRHAAFSPSTPDEPHRHDQRGIFTSELAHRRGTAVDLGDLNWNAVPKDRRPTMQAVDKEHLLPKGKNIDPAFIELMSDVEDVTSQPAGATSDPDEKLESEGEKCQDPPRRKSIFRMFSWKRKPDSANKAILNVGRHPGENIDDLSKEKRAEVEKLITETPLEVSHHASGAVSPHEPSTAVGNKVTQQKADAQTTSKQKRHPHKKHPAFIGGFAKIWAIITGKTKDDVNAPEREPLTTTELICVAVTILLLLVLVSAIAYLLVISFLGHSRTDIIFDCTSSECSEVKNSLTSMLNDAFDPCTDYFGYVCDKWLRSHSFHSFIEYTIGEFHRHFNTTLFRSEQIPVDKYGMHVLTRLYRTCYRFMESSNFTLRTIAAYTSDELNIPQLLNVGSLGEQLTYLVNASLSRGFSTVFSLHFENKEKKAYLYLKSTASVQERMESTVHEASSRYHDYDFGPHMEGYVRDVVKVIYKKDDAESYVLQVMKWDRQFDSLLKKPCNEEYKRIQKTAPLFYPVSVTQVIDLINSLAPPRLALTPSDDTMVVCGFDTIDDVLLTMSNGTLIARGIYFAVHLMTNVLRLFNLRQHLIGASSDIIITTCFRITQQALFHTWPYLVTRKMDYSRRAEEAKGLANSLSRITRKGEGIEWMTEISHHEVDTALDHLDIIAYEDTALHNMQSTYDHLLLEDEDFLFTLFEIKRFETKLLLDWLPTSVGSALARHQVASNLSLQSLHREMKSWIFIPTAYQSPPLFRYNEKPGILPFYMNHPTLGTLVAREMVRAIGPSQRWDMETRKLVKSYMDCLASIRDWLGIKALEGNVSSWRAEAFSWSLGSHMSYNAMRAIFEQHAKKNSAHFVAAQELYFILSCLMTCSSVKSGPLFLPRERCEISLLSNVDFWRYYNCTEVAQLTCISSLYQPG
ncbi:uncharacterized protein LOC135399609 [Ornithodoros turicata]|uniref:uncharacterized protein LOC135399609 n=1 Tax=Ornithodoros turicata TaxID=34597 RepID=UPI0031392EA5